MQTQLALKLEASNSLALTPMMAQYHEIKRQYQDCLLLFRMGDFFELFYEDAVIAAAALDIALTKRGKQESQDIPMCGVPAHAYESYLARLITKGFKVAICEQLEDPETAKVRGAKGPLRRDVIRVVTAGTLTEENLLNARQHNFLVGLSPLRQGKLAVAALDLSTGKFIVESCDNTNVNSILARLNPAEIILPDSLLQQPELFEIVTAYKKILSPLPLPRFDLENCQRTLETAYQVKTLQAFGDFNSLELIAMGVLVDYVHICHKAALNLLTPPEQQTANRFLRIDAPTQRSLELVLTLAGQRQGSILHSLDMTQTAGGSRLLAQYLLAPLTETRAIQERLERIQFFLDRAELRQACRQKLAQCPDLERALTRLHLGRGSPRDLGLIRDGLIQTRELKTSLTAADSILPIIKLGFFDPLIDRLQQALADNLPPHTRDGSFIAAGYLEELDTYRNLKTDSQATLMQLQARYATETGIQTLKIRHNNILGYHIEIGATHATKMPPHFIHRQTMVSHMRYTTPELAEWERKIENAAHQALTLELQLFADLVANVTAHANEIFACAQVLAMIDVASALAELAVIHNYCRPLVDDSTTFIIKGGRHMVVEQALSEPFVKNDCLLEDPRRIILLTGPNMAGKSTYLRQNALIVILAQMGAFVPADFAHIGIVDRIFTRIGAADDLAAGRSTFMVEMIETATILNQATAQSFVILDEIGRGTSTYDGLSIAWAVIEALALQNQCRTLFATHYHELTTLTNTLPMLTNATMQIREWDDKVIFMHQVIPGAADRSYGIHVAALAGVPPNAIQRAETVLQSLEKKNMREVPGPSLPEPPSPLIQTLKDIDIDNLTARQALEILYQLKELAK